MSKVPVRRILKLARELHVLHSRQNSAVNELVSLLSTSFIKQVVKSRKRRRVSSSSSQSSDTSSSTSSVSDVEQKLSSEVMKKEAEIAPIRLNEPKEEAVKPSSVLKDVINVEKVAKKELKLDNGSFGAALNQQPIPVIKRCMTKQTSNQLVRANEEKREGSRGTGYKVTEENRNELKEIGKRMESRVQDELSKGKRKDDKRTSFTK